jgi:hypothetical protein
MLAVFAEVVGGGMWPNDHDPRPPNAEYDLGCYSQAQLIEGYSIRYADEYRPGQRRSQRPICILWYRYPKDEEHSNPIPIHTSSIKVFLGRWFKTDTGDEYRLGKPHERFLGWLEQQGWLLDQENPLNFERNDNFEPVMGPDMDPDEDPGNYSSG